MPGWHERTLQHQANDELQLLGIIQEQHPDRCALFMQWKQMEWPILVDSLNLLETSAVPITILIDESGIVRSINPRPNELDAFLDADFTPVSGDETSTDATLASHDHWDVKAITRALESEDQSASSLSELGSIAFRRSQVDESHHDALLGLAIRAYERAMQLDPAPGEIHFRLGVAYRARYDTLGNDPADFQRAIDHWVTALDINPNQYIWRRRIQQYGPRLDKPYSFYDWVSEAREAIRARGETPVELIVEPQGAELANRRSELASDASFNEHPDPEGRILADAGLINLQTTVVPHTSGRASSGRVHVLFTPDPSTDGHWNNEAEPMKVWIEPVEGWSITPHAFTIPNASGATSLETRRIEFEVTRSGETDPSSVKPTLKGVALFNVCRGETGVCLYRRLPFELSLDALLRNEE